MKSIVEDCLTLAIWDFRSRIFPHSSGKITWAGGGKFSVRFSVASGDAPTIMLHYRCRDNEDVEIPIRLQSTATNFNGKRMWFICPLIVGGVACNRRAGKLYLPPGSRYFGCRQCHDLSYRSSQTAHQDERFIARLVKIKKRLKSLERRG